MNFKTQKNKLVEVDADVLETVELVCNERKHYVSKEDTTDFNDQPFLIDKLTCDPNPDKSTVSFFLQIFC